MSDPGIEHAIDMAIIATLRELGGTEDPHLVDELIDLYLQDAPERVTEIQEALRSGDFDLLERASHTLKSASANIGALGLSAQCAELERMARDRRMDDAERRAASSRASFDAVCRALADLRG